MKKYIVTILTAFMMVLSTGGPSYAFGEDRCLAVFCNPEMEVFWPSLHPDVMKVAYTWDEFDAFLLETRAKAAGRKITIDLDVHGSGKYLCIQYEDARTGKTNTSAAGFGYAINHIEKYLGDMDVVIVCESCFAGETYHNSIRGNKQGENHPDLPKFPIYGASYNMYNLNNLAYMQYVTGCRQWLEDIRTYHDKTGRARIEDLNNPEYRRMEQLYHILGVLYKPDLPQPIGGKE